MAKILFIVASKDFQAQEYSVPKRILEQAGHSIITASNLTTAESDKKEQIKTLVFDQINPEDYDGIIFIGGPGAKQDLVNNSLLHQLATSFYEADKVVAGICHGALVLAKAGLLKNLEATTFPEASKELEESGAKYVNFPVVETKNIITAQDPKAASDFGKLLAMRFEKQKASFKLHRYGSFLIQSALESPLYYHTSGIRYQPGDIIQPYWDLTKGVSEIEIQFEKIRAEHFPTAPSRLKSIFAWPSFDSAAVDAAHFIESGRPRYLYQVSPMGRTQQADLFAYQEALQDPKNTTTAMKYWNCKDAKTIEILLENGAQVISVIPLFNKTQFEA